METFGVHIGEGKPLYGIAFDETGVPVTGLLQFKIDRDDERSIIATTHGTVRRTLATDVNLRLYCGGASDTMHIRLNAKPLNHLDTIHFRLEFRVT